MPSPPRTPTGHHITVHGRRWRASDPAIPAKLRQELVNALMAGRRGVRSDSERGSAARRSVQDAKVALGERGVEWWAAEDGEAGDRGAEEGDPRDGSEPPQQDKKTGDEEGKGEKTGKAEGKLWWQRPAARDGLHGRIDSTIRALCRAREHGTVCPSEVSRCVAGDATEDWRELMPLVRERAERLVRRGQIEITQRGEAVRPGEYRGPIRLRVAEGIDGPDIGERSESGTGESVQSEAEEGGEERADEKEEAEAVEAAGKDSGEDKVEGKVKTRNRKREHTPDAAAPTSDPLPLRSGKRRR